MRALDLSLRIGRPSGSAQPALNLDFLTGILDPRITGTRSTTGTYVGADGLIAIAAINAPRFDYDPVTLAAKGLLIEEQRSNLFLNSKADGTNLATQNVTTTATPYTISFYGTGTITLTGTSTAGPIVGTGAYPNRQTLTFTPTAGTLTCTVSGTVQYAQCEAGAFATSVIFTAASAVTRAADIYSMTGTNFSNWFNPLQGTFVVGGDSPCSGSRVLWQADDGTSNNRITVYTTGTTVKVDVFAGGSLQATLSLGTVAANTPFKVAFRYGVNDFAASLNGAALFTDTSGTVPTVDRCRFGTDAPGTALDGHNRTFTAYSRPLPNTQLQALTQ